MKEKDTVFERKSVGGLCLKIHDTHTVSKSSIDSLSLSHMTMIESLLHREMNCTPDEILKVYINKKKRIKLLDDYVTRLQDDYVTRLQDDYRSFRVQHQNFFNEEERK
jgi:propanediol utilization protein